MKISLIGTGRIAFLLEEDPLRYKPCTHIGAVAHMIKKNPQMHWDYLCDLNESRLKKAHEFCTKINRGREIKITDNYLDLIKSKPDLLIIASDTGTHYDILMKAVKNNIPKIVVEKPIALNVTQARKIHKEAIKRNSRIWVNYERRYHKKYIQLKKDINDNKKYGKALYFRGWFASPNNSFYKSGNVNEGILLHDTTHLIDLIQFLFGKIKSSRHRNNEFNGIFTNTIELKLNSGIAGDILTTAKNRFFHLELEIIFENARISIGNGFLQIQKSQKSRLYKNFISLSNSEIFKDRKMTLTDNPFIKLYANVISGNYDPESFMHACDNIKILT